MSLLLAQGDALRVPLDMWYNLHCLDEQNTRALCIPEAAFESTIVNCGQSALRVRTSVLAVRLGNGGTHGGRFAMPKRVLPPNEVLIDLYNRGLSAREIANQIGANTNTVASMLQKLGICRTSKEAIRLQFRNGRQMPKYWQGKKQPRDMVEKRVSKIRGENHYMWRGGKERRGYREIIEKTICAICGSRKSLGVHHKDLDHYNDDIGNLQVLCNSCHTSLHKKLYWDAIHRGETPKKSNGPVSWAERRKDE